MPLANNILTSAILAPLVTILSAISLVSLQRATEWVKSIATTPQKGHFRTIKPYMKQFDALLDRLLAGNKFDVTTTDLLLMAIVVLLLCLLFETSEARNEKPKIMRPVASKKKAGGEDKDE